MHPNITPNTVPIIPVNAPHMKKTRRMDPSVRPIVRKIPISWLLFLTNMIKPETMFIVAIKTRIERIINIMLSSICKAFKKPPLASRHVHINALFDIEDNNKIFRSSISSGSFTITSNSSTLPSRLK